MGYSVLIRSVSFGFYSWSIDDIQPLLLGHLLNTTLVLQTKRFSFPPIFIDYLFSFVRRRTCTRKYRTFDCFIIQCFSSRRSTKSKMNFVDRLTTFEKMSLTGLRAEVKVIEEDMDDGSYFSMIHELVLVQVYDYVVKLACPLLPRDCQIEIIRMCLWSDYHNQQGLIVKLLPKAKKVHRQATWPGTKGLLALTSTDKELYELRQSFSIGFNFSNLGDIGRKCLLYLVAAFGSKENYLNFIKLYHS